MYTLELCTRWAQSLSEPERCLGAGLDCASNLDGEVDAKRFFCFPCAEFGVKIFRVGSLVCREAELSLQAASYSGFLVTIPADGAGATRSTPLESTGVSRAL